MLTAEKIQAVNAAFTTIETELDFLIALEPSDAKRLSRLGLRNETFSRAALEAGTQNPTVIPQSVWLIGLLLFVLAGLMLLADALLRLKVGDRAGIGRAIGIRSAEEDVEDEIAALKRRQRAAENS